MRNRLCILFLTSAIMLSCSRDEDPRSAITPDEFFLEDRDAQAAVDAIYRHLNQGESVYARNYWLVNALFSELGKSDGLDPDVVEFENFTLTPENQIVEEIWRGLYAGVAKANYAIQHIPRVPISENEKVLLLAEARFLRAVFYFDLVRFFGNIPLVEETKLDFYDLTQPGQSPADTIYDFLENEFNYAFENLPSISNPGRPTNYAAAAYLCKLSLTTKNYSRAAQASRYVIQGPFTLLPDYGNLFKNSSQNNSEFIWSINLNASNGSDINAFTLPVDLGGRDRLFAQTEAFYNIFPELDHRRTITFLTSYIDKQGNLIHISPHLIKFWDPESENLIGKSAVDFPIIRFADILLLHAEALNELRNGSSAEALGAINLVRTRARFDGTTAQNVLPDLGRLNKEEFAEAILEERKRELGWEGHRWFDLVRFGKLEEKIKEFNPEKNVSSKDYLLPLPASEIELNKNLNQNPGY